MKSIQYTIRSIPPNLDQALRDRARKTGKSLNEVTIDSLSTGVGLKENTVFTDLDWFIGSKNNDDLSLEKSMNWLDKLPNDLDSNL